jgi:hypothetical protein
MDASFGSKDNLLSFNQSSPTDHGRTVLNLVFQAAEVFSGMEEQVRETEVQAGQPCLADTFSPDHAKPFMKAECGKTARSV